MLSGSVDKGSEVVQSRLVRSYVHRQIFKFVGFIKDCDQNGDRMSKNDGKLPYLHWVTKKLF